MIASCVLLILSIVFFLGSCGFIQKMIDEYKFHCWYAKNSDKTLEELFDEGAESIRYLTKDFVLSEKFKKPHLKIFRQENV